MTKTLLCWKTLALAGAALAAGCTMVGPDFQRPAPMAVDRYTAQPLALESAATSGDQHVAPGRPVETEWWKSFHSEACDAIVQRALAGNRTLVAAAASLAQAEELANAQAGTLAPQVGLGASVGRQKLGAASLGDFSLPPFTYFSVGPTVSYVFDYTGAGRRSVEAQQALAEYRRHQVEGARLAVVGNALTQALRAASLRTQIQTVEELLGRDRENLRLVQVAFDAGSVARLDIVSAQAQLAADQTLLPPLRQQLSLAQHALAILTGSAPAQAALPEFDLGQVRLPTTLPLDVPSELARRRPDILAAEAQLHASTAAVGVAEGNLYPRINITASAGLQSGQFQNLFESQSSVFGLAAGLTAPLFDGGTLRAERRAAMDAMHADAANYEQTVLQAFGQVADTLQALEHGGEELQARSRAQDAARDDVELTRRSYQEGNVGVLQVLDAERRYQQARLGYVQAQGQRYIDTVQLYLALGGGVLG
ncbi:MAG TPA: efflux transporter outer membrane subunit [Variovorax sp.]|jgi:NodT family efflux transporter outer membrane factor (OMF) lipoprotein